MDPSPLAVLGSTYLAAVFVKSLGRAAAKRAGQRIGDALGEATASAVSAVVRSLGSKSTPIAWRLGNLRAVGRRAERIARRANVPPREVPLSFLFPLAEEASKVDEKALQEMWAHLLVSGIGNDRNQQPMFIHILRNLSTEDAQFVRGLAMGTIPDAVEGIGLKDPRWRSVNRLRALGVVEVFNIPMNLWERAAWHVFGGPDGPQVPVILSGIGWDFFMAVGGPDADKAATRLEAFRRKKAPQQ